MAADTFVKYFTAGGVGAMVSHAGAVPLDVVKTRVQQDPARFEGLGVAGSASALVADEGISPATRHVRGSNYCVIGVFEDRIPGRCIVVSVIDNVCKGASGQALATCSSMSFRGIASPQCGHGASCQPQLRVCASHAARSSLT